MKIFSALFLALGVTFLLPTTAAFGQNIGDYRTNGPVTMVAALNWQTWNPGWGAAVGPPLNLPPNNNVEIRAGHVCTFDPAGPVVWGSLTVTNGTLTFNNNAPRMLSVTGAVTVNGGTVNVSAAAPVQVHIFNIGGSVNNNGAFIMTVGPPFPSVCNVTMNGGIQLIAGVACTLNDLTISPGSTVTANTPPAVSGMFTVSNGGKYIHTTPTTIPGMAINLGESSTYEIQNAGMMFTNVPFGNLIINFAGASNLDASGNLQIVHGNLTIQNTGTAEFRLCSNNSPVVAIDGDVVVQSGTFVFTSGNGAPTVNVAGDVNITGGTLRPMGAGAMGVPIFTVMGNWSNAGTFTAGTGAVTFTSTTGGKSLSGTLTGASKFYNLTFNGGGGSWSFSGNTEVANNFTIMSGSVTAPSTTLTIGGSYSNSATFTHNNGTVIMNSAAPGQTLSGSLTGGSRLYNLTFNGAGGWTFSNPAEISNNLTITAGSVTAPPGNLTIGGSYGNSGSFTNNNGTVIMNATAAGKTLSGSMTGPDAFYNLTFDSPGGGWTFGGAAEVKNDLKILSGIVTAPASTATVGGLYSNTGTFTHNNGTVIMNSGSPGKTLSGTMTGPSKFFNLTFTNAGGAWSFTASAEVANNFTITSGSVTAPPISLTIGGNYSNSGSFAHNGSTVTFNAGTPGKTLSGSMTAPNAFNNLTFNGGGGGWSFIAAAEIENNFSIMLGMVTAPASFLSIKGNYSNTGSFTNNNGTVIMNMGSGSKQLTGSMTGPNRFYHLTFHGVGPWTIASAADLDGDLTITGGNVTLPGSVLTVKGNWNNTGFFSHNSGTVTFNGNTQIQSGGANTFNHIIILGTLTAAASNMNVEGNWNNTGTFNHNHGSVTMSGLSNQSLMGTTFYDLVISNHSAQGVTLGPANVIVEHVATILSGSTLNDGGVLFQVRGQITNSGSHTGIGKIQLTNSLSPLAIYGNGTFNNLELNDPTGATLYGNPQVNGVLTLTTGILSTGGNKITLRPSASVSRTNGHVNGRLEKHIPAGATARTFEIGDASQYAPVSISFGNVSAQGYLTAGTTAGDHPNITTSGINPSKSVNRYWAMTNSGIVFDNYSATFNFVLGDIDGGANTDTFMVKKYNTPVWSSTTTGTRTGTSTQATGLTSFSDFQIGELQLLTITASASTHGTISPSGAISVIYGTDQAFTMTPDEHCHIDSVLVDGASVGAEATHTFTNVTSSHTIQAEFSIDHFTISATKEGNGTLTPAGSVIVQSGGDTAFAFVPDLGWHLDTLFVDGAAVDSTNHYTFHNVTGDHSLRVKFAINRYTITVTSSPHGSVTPGTTVLDYGQSQTFMITPDSSYFIDSVVVDGVYRGALDSVRFTNVILDHTLKATFTKTILMLPVRPSWNMVSMPLTMKACKKIDVFPSATSSAFAYDGMYLVVDTLKPGPGYWLKFATAESVTMCGKSYTTDTFALKAGWNMIGSISTPVPVKTITSDPPGLGTSSFFGYTGSYNAADTIFPGRGYWVKVDVAGSLILSYQPTGELKARIKLVPSSAVPPAPPEESNEPAGVPGEYALFQAYPNPFNPATTIRYQLPYESRVTLRIYSLLGEAIATLADEIQPAGYRCIQWNASGCSSGVYFYRIEAVRAADPGTSFTDVKKILFLR